MRTATEVRNNAIPEMMLHQMCDMRLTEIPFILHYWQQQLYPVPHFQSDRIICPRMMTTTGMLSFEWRISVVNGTWHDEKKICQFSDESKIDKQFAMMLMNSDRGAQTLIDVITWDNVQTRSCHQEKYSMRSSTHRHQLIIIVVGSSLWAVVVIWPLNDKGRVICGWYWKSSCGYFESDQNG